jgi:uncharacterized membrane protein YphA (DoxX/SURF4 family)
MHQHEDKNMKKLLLLLFFFLIPSMTSAHVGYILSEQEFQNASGLSRDVFISVFSSPLYVFLMLFTLVVVLCLVYLLKRSKQIKRMTRNLERKEKDYKRVFPWIIRLSLGIALLGAGSSGVLISPSVQDPTFMFLQTLLGFLLLTGFLLELAIVLTIGLFLFALAGNFYLVGNLDFLALAIAFFFIGESRPGIDDLLEVPCYCLLTKIKDFLPLVLRVGIGGGMMFLALYEKLLNPLTSLQIVEDFSLTAIIPVSAEMWVVSAGLIEFAVGLFLFLGFYTRVTSIIAFAVLSLSFFFFGEDVYSHVTLFGTLSILVVTGGNKWSLDNLISTKKTTRKDHLV